MTIRGIDHVQLAMPEGGEDAARAFYGGVLGFEEVPKPAALAGRGGVWFECGEVRVHLGVEPGFTPARKAHPAFLVNDRASILEACRAHGHAIEDAVPLEGVTRAYVSDPFGNRIELMERAG